MKYKDLSSFDNHIKKSLPDHVSQGFLLTCQNGEEREYLLDALLKKLLHFFPAVEVWRYDKERFDLGAVREKLSSGSLFHEGAIYLFPTIDELDATLLELLKKELQSIQKDSFFLLGSSSGKGKVATFYTECKKELIALDLSEEKPWHRKERWTGELFAYAKRSQKILEPSLVEKLVSLSQMQVKLLFSMLDRCILFAGKKELLTLQEMEPILPLDPEEKLWEIAEKLVWSGQIAEFEEADWLPFLGAVRYQLQIGLKLLGSKHPSSEDFPKLPKARFDKYLKLAKELGFSYFQQGILYIFTLEVDAKNFLDPKKALDLLTFYFQQKKSHAPSFAKPTR
jgi:hypothetical protein